MQTIEGVLAYKEEDDIKKRCTMMAHKVHRLVLMNKKKKTLSVMSGLDDAMGFPFPENNMEKIS